MNHLLYFSDIYDDTHIPCSNTDTQKRPHPPPPILCGHGLRCALLQPIFSSVASSSSRRSSFFIVSPSTGRSASTNRFGPPLVLPVVAQARRGSSLKEDEVASPSDLQFEPPLKIVEYPDPTLRAENKRIDTFDDNLKKLVHEMFDRPASVKIDARDVNGAGFTVNLSGLPARVFQHEFDHLQGVLFFDRMTEGVLDCIHEQLQAFEKKYEDKAGFPSPERIDQTCKKKKVAVGFGKSS